MQDIIFYFGVPNSIITNNDTQFSGEKLFDFCDDKNIRWTGPRSPTRVQMDRSSMLMA
jgi:hypothetical protein